MKLHVERMNPTWGFRGKRGRNLLCLIGHFFGTQWYFQRGALFLSGTFASLPVDFSTVDR